MTDFAGPLGLGVTVGAQSTPVPGTGGVFIGSSDQITFDYLIGKTIIGGGQFGDTLGRFYPVVINANGILINTSDAYPSSLTFHQTKYSGQLDVSLSLDQNSGLVIAPTTTGSTRLSVFDRTTANPWGLQFTTDAILPAGHYFQAGTAFDATPDITAGYTNLANSTTASVVHTVSGASIASRNHIRCFIKVRAAAVGLSVYDLYVRLNADSGANYNYGGWRVTSANTNSMLGATAANQYIPIRVPSALLAAGHAATLILDIVDSASAAGFQRTMHAHGGGYDGTDYVMHTSFCQWANTAAVTSITFSLSSGNFAANSQFYTKLVSTSVS